MSSESDGEMEASFSCMKQPPLIKQLQGILSMYPDNGQIIKELIQNAEDAGATEIEFVCDSREINTIDGHGTRKEYRKFFQGPAMCVYNNAIFTDDDWEGVQMIYSSVKEGDRRKVGRFGLGFKSVFHLTDYPCILSGNILLVIDPQQPSDKVNARMEIKKLDKYKGMDVEAFFKALEGRFGIERDIIRQGKFDGTLFWFPLRTKVSALSKNTYNVTRLRELFEIFRNEAQTILLFLRNVTNVSISGWKIDGSFESLASVRVTNEEDIKQNRNDFNADIDSLESNYRGEPLMSALVLDIKFNDNGLGNSASKSETLCSWLVVNYFCGNNTCSPNFRSLIEDSDIKLSPLVGIAAPIRQGTSNLDGHTFCFLPLPREGSRLTGLPVHVNGFFALDQSRHHLQWATDEQSGHQISEKSIQWNECLIAEALPMAYRVWFENAVKISKQSGNTKDIIKSVQSAIPDIAKTEGKWLKLLHPLFQQLRNLPVLFSFTSFNWIQIRNVLILKDNTFNDDQSKAAILKAVTSLKLEYAEVSNIVYNALTHEKSFLTSILTPEKLAINLRNSSICSTLNTTERMFVLAFLRSGGNKTILEDLELLPLESGGWTRFAKDSTPIYICSAEQVKLFPSLEKNLLRSQISVGDHRQLEDICREGNFQLRRITSTDIQNLLQELMQRGLTVSGRMVSKDLSLAWLRNVWQYLQKNNMESFCQRIPLFPLLLSGNWKNPDLKLVKICKTVIHKGDGQQSLPDDICQCLKTLGVDIIFSFPSWLEPSRISGFAKKPSRESISEILEYISQPADRPKLIKTFNSINEEQRYAFMLYLAGSRSHSSTSLSLMRSLDMFKERLSAEGERYTSVVQNANFTKCRHFPVKYPNFLIDGTDTVVEHLLTKLECREWKLHHIFNMTFRNIRNYGDKERELVLKYFLLNYHSFKSTLSGTQFNELKDGASTIPFLHVGTQLKKPSQLFSPEDPVLNDLFFGQNVFPTFVSLPSAETISILEDLGLKKRSDITAKDLLEVAVMLDKWSNKDKDPRDLRRKSRAFVKVLSEIPNILEQVCEGKSLKLQLKDMCCIEYLQNPPERFPAWMPWFCTKSVLCKPQAAKTSKYLYLVGSVLPLVDCKSDMLSNVFGWNDPPQTDDVIHQLNKTVNNYKTKNTNPYILLGYLYEWLSECSDTELEKLKQKNIIWTGNGFVHPARTIMLKDETDIETKPYFYFIPKEIQEYKSFFEQVGCKPNQSIDLLIETLEEISKTNSLESGCIQYYLELAVKILNKCADKIGELSENSKMKILVPIRTDDQNVLKLLPVDECTYDENPERYIQYEESVHVNFVHESVSCSVAKAIGIKSWLQTGLSETEEVGIEEWGQEESLTDRIRGLLDGYKDGMSVPKELIQNADDAGASVVKFLYDERENLGHRKSLLTESMNSCQGPALWVYNDSTFTDDDFENIIKLNGATKRNKLNTIGKFGLGFCSVYNITDVPSFVSGSNIVILDPHKSHLNEVLSGSKPGIKIDMQRPRNKDLVSRNKDQFQTFCNVFGCNLRTDLYFDGTLFRLPLRTNEDARRSKICQLCYSDRDMRELLQMLIKTAGDLLLFTQNITQIEIHHLPRNSSSPTEQKLLFSISRTDEIIHRSSDELSSSILSAACACQNEILIIQSISISMQLPRYSMNILSGLYKYPEKLSQRWIVSWATGRNNSILVRNKKGVSLSAVAVPCRDAMWIPDFLHSVPLGTYSEGHMFCFLPLPKTTGLPWHMHGCFETTSDRRQLPGHTEDDKKNRQSKWNENLLGDATVNAFIELLLFLSKQDTSGSYDCYQLWPFNVSEDIVAFKHSFYKQILTHNHRIFRGLQGWTTFSNAVFLHPDIRENPETGDVLFHMISSFQSQFGPHRVAINMPRNIFNQLTANNSDHLELIETNTLNDLQVISIFLRNINDTYWQDKTDCRNKVILYALRIKHEKITSMLKETKCIPCESFKSLRLPCEVVHPSHKISAMFQSKDGRYPISEFRQSETLDSLVELGMLTCILPTYLLFERCQSIQDLGNQCCICSSDRIKAMVRYLATDQILQNKPDVLNKLREQYILPVVNRPTSWEFSWYSDKCESVLTFENKVCSECDDKNAKCLKIGKPSDMVRQDVADILGSVVLITNESWDDIFEYAKERVLSTLLEVKSRNNVKQLFDKIVQQICIVTSQYCEEQHAITTLKDILDRLYDCLQNIFEHCSEMEEHQFLSSLEVLKKTRTVLIGKELVMPDNVAVQVKEECLPAICRLPDTEQRKRFLLYSKIGVRDSFDTNDILCEMARMKEEWCENPCDEIEKAIKLLINLEDIIIRSDTDFTSMDHKDKIYVPDRYRILRQAAKLVVDDEGFETDTTVHIVHDKVAPALAHFLGVKSKRNRCIDDISYGIPFGQKEELTTRLQTLLQAYPFGVGIMKELLQNADDAGATELHFVKDFRNHPSGNILVNEKFQGPSLCVYNNSYFSENDLQGIHDLGLGSKRRDPTKSGQYGVGFNAVYHFTDTPSFYSISPKMPKGGVLCVFDPTCCNIPTVKHNEPGMKYYIHDIKANFPNQLKGFSECLGSETGTMFRFPLRTERSTLSNKVCTTEMIDEMLSSFTKEMSQVMIFLKKVRTIKVSNITSGVLKTDYVVSASLVEEDERKLTYFYKQLDLFKTDMLQNPEIEMNLTEVQYTLSVTDEINVLNEWLVVQRIGFSDGINVPKDLCEYFRTGELCQMPVGGIALPLKNLNRLLNALSGADGSAIQLEEFYKKLQTSFSGTIFTFLPIPGETGLPVHVNGHFVLDHEARQGLCKSGVRHEWNLFLIHRIIVPSMVHAIEFVKDHLIHKTLTHITSWRRIKCLMRYFHSMFPVFSKVQDRMWRYFVETFYAYIQTNGICIFPVISRQLEYFGIKWVPLKSEGYLYGAVFNVIQTNLELNEKDKLHAVENILKEIGMNLIETPIAIMKTMQECRMDILESDPKFILNFLQSFKENINGSCNLGNVGVNIAQTVVGTADNLKLIFLYITKSKTFQSDSDNLPVILTADLILRQSSVNDTIYNSPHWSLLPTSAHMFLHESLLSILPPTKSDKAIIRPLGVTDFASLLPDSVNADAVKCLRKIRWDKEANEPLSVLWIAKFFQFLYDNSAKFSRSTKSSFCDAETFKANIDIFADWSFFPTIDSCSGPEYALTPLCKPFSIFRDDYDCKDVNEILRKIDLPVLDESVFKDSDLQYRVKTLVACSRNPYSILTCLYENMEKLLSCSLTEDDAAKLMMYFNQSLEKLKEANDPELIHKIKCLPLFITQERMHINLANKTNVFLLPLGMPVAGIQEWSHATNNTFLLEIYNVGGIYKLLNLQKQSHEDVYAKLLLPQITCLPREHWHCHILYIKNNLLLSSVGLSFHPPQLIIIEHLRNIGFIPVGNKYKKPKELYDETNPVFKCMVDQSDILPQMYYQDGWREFLIMLGLNVEVTDALFIQFALAIETEGSYNLDSNTLKKSKLLTNYLMTSLSVTDWSHQSLQAMKMVKFISPYVVCEQMSSIFDQLNKASILISFDGSVSSDFKAVCWTTVDLLPSEFIPNTERIRNVLGILKFPPVELVVSHSQNICHVLNNLLRTNCVSVDFSYTIMRTIYEFLKPKTEKDLQIASDRLKHTPFVFIPRDNVFVITSYVVLGLEEQKEIKPYLYGMPLEFFEYSQLFLRLGATQNPHCNQFIAVLKLLKMKTQNNILTRPELVVSKRCIEQLETTLLLYQKVTEFPLYLPNSEFYLKDASTLIIADSEYLEKRIMNGNLGLDFFIGYDFLEIRIGDPRTLAHRLPDNLKPLLLTKIICERIELGNLCIHDDCEYALELGDFLHSTELIEGVIRLVIDKQSRIYHEEYNHIESIQRQLKSVKVKRVTGLRTECYYKGLAIQGSSGTKRCFIKEELVDENRTYVLYFERETEVMDNLLQQILLEYDGLIHLINICIRPFEVDTRLLSYILLQMQQPVQIKEFLDQSLIPAFTLSDAPRLSVYPIPGSYVPEIFHAFLEQGIDAIDEQEYRTIALELEDNAMESNDASENRALATYIYVRILKELQIRNLESDIERRYLVQRGGVHQDPVVIPVYRLYRFVRREVESGTDMVGYDEQPNVSFTFDTNCKRIKKMLEDAWKLPTSDRKMVVKRLLLKWHPDKNVTNKEYCKHVFIFIKYAISQLDSGRQIEETIQNQDNNATSQSGSAFSDLYNNINKSAETLSRGYRDNLEEYNRFHRTGIHSQKTNLPRPDISKAKQWLRQAKNDYRVAELYFPTIEAVEGFNWICYTCHQACEKSLKAAGFNIDRNNVPERSHSLTEIANSIGNSQITEKVRQLEHRLGEHTRMRYPDVVAYPNIPSDIFHKEDAIFSMQTAKEVIECVDEFVGL